MFKVRVCKEKQLYRNIPNHDYIWIVTERGIMDFILFFINSAF